MYKYCDVVQLRSEMIRNKAEDKGRDEGRGEGNKGKNQERAPTAARNKDGYFYLRMKTVVV